MRGRRRRGSVKIVLTLRLDPDLDADLLDWLRALPKGERVRALKGALRHGGVTRDECGAGQDDLEASEAAENILGTWNF